MINKKKENSVKSLVSLYTVVIGVALSLAVVTLIEPTRGLASVTLAPVLLFVAFIATLFPFYHGALRHLDDAYIENENPNIKDGALVIDFILLFFHGLAFVVLSLLLGKPAHFAWVLTVLIFIDVVWGIFAHFASSSGTAEWRWTIINVIFVGAAIWYLLVHDISLNYAGSPIKLAVPVMVACIIRTVVDYAWCIRFYFPK